MTETPAFDRYAATQAVNLARIYAFQAELSAPEWSEQVRRMDGGRRYRFSYAPFQREMMEAPFDPEVQLTAFQLASRLGKTETVMNIIGHSIAESPRRILVLYPTSGQADKWSKETLEKELFEWTEPLKGLVRGGRRSPNNTILHKIFPGGVINIFGGNSPGEMRRAKGNLLFADEIDALQEQVSDEGDQLDIFWTRGSEYHDAIKIAASYPGTTGKSRIASMMDRSDFRKWNTPCAKCGEPIILLREHVKHPDGRPDLAEVEAPCCGRMITDDQRRAMVNSPDSSWQPTKEFKGVRGYWGNGMMSPHPSQKGFKSHLHWVAQRQIDVAESDSPDRAEKVLVNTFDANTYTPASIEAPDADALKNRLEKYKPREMLPEGVYLITAGVDIQKDRIEVSVWGWGENKESWRLEYHRVSGNVDDPQTWVDLDNYLANCSFPHPLGVNVELRGAMVDASKWNTTVCEWTKPRAARRIYAIQGSPTINAPILKKRDEFIKGTKRKVRIYAVGVNQAKDILYSRLTLSKPSRGEEPPVGYIHFNQDCADSYFDGLTCEYGKEETFRGEIYTRYVNPPGKRNEPLDTYVYAYAGMKLVTTPMSRVRLALEQRAKAPDAEQPQPRPQRSTFGKSVGGGSWL